MRSIVFLIDDLYSYLIDGNGVLHDYFGSFSTRGEK